MLDRDTRRREPAFNMPGLILAAIAVLIAIHLGREWLPSRTDFQILFEGGFVPARWSIAAGFAQPDDVVREAAAGIGDADEAALQAALGQFVVASGGPPAYSIVTYALLHGSWMHVILNCVWLAAFGSPVVRRCGSGRAAILALVTSVGAALAYWVVNPLSVQLMIGASGAVSGFMGAAALFVFERRRGWGAGDVLAGRSSLASLLRNRSALLFLGTWFAINLAVGFAAGPLGIVDGGVAWQAHIGGLVSGILAFPLLDPVGRRPDPSALSA